MRLQVTCLGILSLYLLFNPWMWRRGKEIFKVAVRPSVRAITRYSLLVQARSSDFGMVSRMATVFGALFASQIANLSHAPRHN